MLKDIVEDFRGRGVLVVGDVMLDEYIWGEVHRISPEAPVACRRGLPSDLRAGGAANVARNVMSLGGQAFLCGVTGNDLLRGYLHHELLSQFIDTDGLITDDKRPTTTKTRVIAHNQQIVRVDSELRTCIGADIEEALLKHIASVIEQVDVCILSDYGKGVVSPYVSAAIH
ncbi:MAG: PfkB family carbohydrate kinase [Pyrinomonadaceae bacterium]